MKKMNGMLRSAVSVALVLCMVLSCAGPVLALDFIPGGKINYVSLGSSVTAGFGLSAQKDAYPYQVASALEKQGYKVELTQLAINAMRAEELHMLLDDTYGGDAYTADRFLGDDGIFAQLGGIDKLRQEYKDAIASADVITVDIGANNFREYVMEQIISGGTKYPVDLTSVMEPGMKSLFLMGKNVILNAVFNDPNVEKSPALDAIIDSMLYAMMGYAAHFEAAMASIYALNPDAQVVVLGLQNPLEDLSIELAGVELDLTKAYSAVFDLANAHAATGSSYASKYYFAAPEQIPVFLDELKAYNGDPATLSQNIKDCFDLYDMDLQIQTMVQEEFEEYLAANNQELTGPIDQNEDYQRALAAAYDTAAKLLQIGAKMEKADLYSIITDYDKTESKLLDLIQNNVRESVQNSLEDTSFTYKPDSGIVKDEAITSVLALGVRFYIGGGFFTHPNAEGHAVIAAGIVNALENKIHGGDVVDLDLGDIISKLMGEGSKIYEDATSTGYFPNKNSYYVALGDGSAAPSTDKKGNPVNPYPYYIQQHFDVKYLNLAVKNMAAADTHSIIEKNIDSIAKADLITLGYTINTFTGKMADEMNTLLTAQGKPEHDWSLYLEEDMIAVLEQVLEDLHQELLDMGLDGKYMTGMTFADIGVFVIESYLFQLVEHVSHYPQVIEEIRAVNPDAQIVLVGMTNTMSGHVLNMEDSMFPLGDYMQYIVEAANAHYRLIAITNEDVIFVDVPEGEWQPISENKPDKTHKLATFLLQLGRLKGDFFSVKPDIHEEQAKVLIEALSVNHYGDADGDGDVDNVDAMKILQKFVGLLPASSLEMENCDVDMDGDVDNVDAMMVLQRFVGLVPSLPVQK